ncbi:hypothetical protein ACQ4M3_13095 [Leptolyngbya sp. AN03gr2]|uniref:hypothetical protein n=1 Tax=unclassified Leptolyngbya TaxID=2650499 RepID=UPI003D31B89A
MTRTKQIVPHIAYLHRRTHPYQLPKLERMEVLYSTPTTVRGKREEVNNPEGRASLEEQSLKINEVFCLPDTSAWKSFQSHYQQFDRSLGALAVELDQMGSYRQQIESASSLSMLPARLSATVVKAYDTNAEMPFYSGWDTVASGSRERVRWQIPRCTRIEIERHTVKMLRYSNGTTVRQENHFICRSDAAWRDLEAVVARSTEAQVKFLILLEKLGSYQEALTDKRYAQMRSLFR